MDVALRKSERSGSPAEVYRQAIRAGLRRPWTERQIRLANKVIDETIAPSARSWVIEVISPATNLRPVWSEDYAGYRQRHLDLEKPDGSIVYCFDDEVVIKKYNHWGTRIRYSRVKERLQRWAKRVIAETSDD